MPERRSDVRRGFAKRPDRKESVGHCRYLLRRHRRDDHHVSPDLDHSGLSERGRDYVEHQRDECQEFAVRAVPDRDQQEATRRTTKLVRDSKVIVFRDNHSVEQVRHPGDLVIARPVPCGERLGVPTLVTRFAELLAEAPRNVSVEQEVHRYAAGTVSTVPTRAASAAYSNVARMSSGSRSG